MFLWCPPVASLPEAKVEPGRLLATVTHRTRYFCAYAKLPGARHPPGQLPGFPVAISEGSYPFPSRTRKSSPPEPMVLHALRVGE